MKQLLNTLYVTSEDLYLALDGENVVVKRGDEIVHRRPLHTLQEIITFSYAGASPALMGACAEKQIDLVFCTPRGKFLARVQGMTNGNVLLRRKQYRLADDPDACCTIARNMIYGKIYNCRSSIERTRRDHGMRVDTERLMGASVHLCTMAENVQNCCDPDTLRGLEGESAQVYFGVLDEMILNQKDVFTFDTRNRRPPLDPVNAMLSFAYSLLEKSCAAALESVGLDAYVGFLHRDRPGRDSLALDLMEELRPCMADRFVLTLINNRVMHKRDFEWQGSGAVRMTKEARMNFLKSWQEKKKETLTHPYLQEKLEWGMIPFVQAMLLARYLRGDIDGYPPFLWK